MRKIFRNIHLWLGLPAGAVLTVICLTGAILVYEDHLMRLSHRDWYYVDESVAEPMPLDELIARANEQLDSNRIVSIQLFSDPRRTNIAGLSKGFRVSAFINPYTAEVTGIYHYREGFFFKIMSLHRWLMDPGRATGKLITGISTLFMVVILISGISIWFPRKRNKLRQFFLIKWRSGHRRLLYDLHRIGGVYAVVFLLLLSLTGLMWSFQWYRNGIMDILNVKTQTTSAKVSAPRPAKPEIDFSAWQQVAGNVKQQTDYTHLRIEEGVVTVLPPDAPHSRATDRYLTDSAGNINKAEFYRDRHDSGKVMGWAYALHTGAWGGSIMKFLTFFAALLGASLPVTGYILYFRRKKRRK